MVKKIVISSFKNIAAVLQNGRVEEIIVINNNYQINDIFLGSVHKIFSGINAAFIDLILHKKSGFIHLNDIRSMKKSYGITQISEVVSINQLILVQIVKEPTLNKGPRLTANISLFGRYLVLMPFCNTINISRKIYDRNERSYLHALAILIKPATMGLLIRSSASGISEEVLIEDFRFLQRKWSFIQKLSLLASSPSLLYRDEDLVQKVIRDFYKDNVSTIITDSDSSLKQIHYYLNKWHCIASVNNLKVKLYKQPELILDKFHIQRTIVNALKSKVSLVMGGYLFIENYEALTVIDVNSGSFNQADNSKETVLKTNCYAATEIAYQLKVRNINGVIIIDFIDMESHRDQLQLLEHFHQVLSIDDAKPQIIQLSKLGLVELTRRRRGQSLYEIVYGKYRDDPVINLKSAFDLKSIKEKNLLYRNINMLFFSIAFCNIKIMVKHLDYSKTMLQIINFDIISLLQLRYTFFVPLILYSEVIDITY